MVQFNIHLKYLDCQCHSDILTSSIKVLVDNLHLEPPQLSQCMVPLRLHDSSWQLNICATASSWRTYKMSVWHPNSCTLASWCLFGTLIVVHLVHSWCRFGTLIVERCRPGTGKLSGAVLRVCQWGAGSRKDRNTGHRNRSVSNQFGPHGMWWIQNGTVRTGLTM